MPKWPGRFRTAVGAGWVLLATSAFVYARAKGIPAWAAFPLAAAFLFEYPFYLLPAFAPERLRLPWLLTISAVIPYLIYSLPTGQFRISHLVMLGAVAGAVVYWYVLLPKKPVTDALFLAILAGVVLTKLFDRIYTWPDPKLQVSFLGKAMLIRVAAIAILAIRGQEDLEYRFVPRGRDFLVGAGWFLASLPVLAAALWKVGLWQLKPHPNAALGIAQLFGILWFVALPEEFFFRGLLQRWLGEWTGNAVAALILASFLFGSSHLGVHLFPNWRYAIVAGILGLFCGLAWRQTRSIGASMVTHAMAATVYRVFFV